VLLEDVELGDTEELAAKYPAAATALGTFSVPAKE
jgi:hypothetical protein